MNFRQLETFLVLYKNKSFSKTAKQLYLTQPTISSNISSLEKELGVRLFTRNTKEVELTKDGEKLYIHAKDILEKAEFIKTLFNERVDKEEDKILLISASSIPSTYILPDILTEFVNKYDESSFVLKENDSLGVINEVKEHRVELGFCGTTGERQYCKYIPFCTDKLVIAMPNTTKYQNMIKSKDLKTIMKEPFVIRCDGSGTKKETKKRLKENNIDFDELNIVATLDSTQGIIHSIKSGMGISVISELAILENIQKKEIITFDLSGEEREFYIVHNINYPLSKSAKRFIKIIKDKFNI